jgi:hypothetical protein
MFRTAVCSRFGAVAVFFVYKRSSQLRSWLIFPAQTDVFSEKDLFGMFAIYFGAILQRLAFFSHHF